MTPTSLDLERLISRYLDDEATPHERRELERLMRSDPSIEILVDEIFLLDREAGRVLRQVMGRTTPFPAGHSRWSRVGQMVMLATAAALALATWLSPTPQTRQRSNDQYMRANNSWFAPYTPRTDGLQAVNPAYEQPQLRLRNTDRHWIIIPSERSGEYLLIEMDRVRTHAIVIQDEF